MEACCVVLCRCCAVWLMRKISSGGVGGVMKDEGGVVVCCNSWLGWLRKLLVVDGNGNV